LILDDILDSGHTLAAIRDKLDRQTAQYPDMRSRE
jgi:hypoxanthine-guanine phosphoribosyltransferase